MTNFKARPTTYKGVKMRSRLEAGFASWLDAAGFAWTYEPCAFATERGQYLPDFRVEAMRASWRPEPVVAYIEVKPASWNPIEVEDDEAPVEDVMYELAQQMSVIWESEPDALCLLAQQNHGVSYLVMEPGYVKNPWAWFYKAEWARGPEPTPGLPGGRPMLAAMMNDESKPWPDGYWKVR